MTAARRLPQVWYCTEHSEIHQGWLESFSMEHRMELHPVFWEPKIGWSPRSFADGGPSYEFVECIYCHSPLAPGERRPASEPGTWACRDGEACVERTAIADKHIPEDPFAGLDNLGGPNG